MRRKLSRLCGLAGALCGAAVLAGQSPTGGPRAYPGGVAPVVRDPSTTQVVQGLSTGQRAVAAHQSAAATNPSSEPQALLKRYCITCHNQRLKTGGVVLETLDISRVAQDAEVWEKVVRKLRMGTMPPLGSPRPPPEAYDEFAAWLEGALDRSATVQAQRGRTEPFRRLNRAEYANTIRDVLALEMDVTSLLPADGSSYGFDTIASALKVSEGVLEQYLFAARSISRAALGSALPDVETTVFSAPEETPQYDHIEGLPFGTRGGILARHYFPQDGEYLIQIEPVCRKQFATCVGAFMFPDEHTLELLLDGRALEQWTLAPKRQPAAASSAPALPSEQKPELASEQKPELASAQKFAVRLAVRAGAHDVGATFRALPSVEEVQNLRRRFTRPVTGGHFTEMEGIYQPFVDSVSITGPIDAVGPGDTPSRRRILVCQPRRASEEPPCARKILSALARQAFRRPVNAADLQPLLAAYVEGRKDGDFETGIELALRRLLMSPEFLVRAEAEPAVLASDGAARISDLELASRLSFFLWSSIPDDELLGLATQGTLRVGAVLEQQIRRMLASPRSDALILNFAGQWLRLRNLDAIRPDLFFFPDFDETLRQSMRRETELFVGSILREDRSALELLTADYTFLNERLAQHYGIPHVQGSHFRRVTLDDENPRRGLLGHGSILTETSRPNRTSPVLRGVWLLENILGMAPPPPPPNVPALQERPAAETAKVSSVRDRTAHHRANPTCAACHSVIDPPGFALENFDAVGRWRDVDESFAPIDASGVMADGVKFAGFEDFRLALVKRPDRFITTFVEKLLTYGLGRGLTYHDMPTVRQIVRHAGSTQYKMSDLIVSIASSPAFQRQGTAAAAATMAAGRR